MKYYIEVAKVYGKDTLFKPETTITKGKSFSLAEAQRKAKLMQKYTKCLIYKVRKERH